MLNAASSPFTAKPSPLKRLQLKPSPLHPRCRADERIFSWRGVNTPPSSVIDAPLIRILANLASRTSLQDTTGYGSGLRKYHLFCDIFSIPEERRLPASFDILHSFALWAAADIDILSPQLTLNTPLEPISVSVTRKYLAAIRAWHLAQGWPPPLSENDHERIKWSLRGLERIQADKRSVPPRPPITLHMLSTLKSKLDLSSPFDACVWAMSSCAFWGMMRFGEVSVTTRSTFSPSRHLKHHDAHLDYDAHNKLYTRLDAKTVKPGQTQSVFLTEQDDLCPIDALIRLSRIVPAGPNDPLFSWRDSCGDIRPMVKTRAIDQINGILSSNGWGNAFGHSFRIGGASYYLAHKVDLEIVRITGRWKSLAYEAYIRAFELVASAHMSNLPNNQ
ncbi:hypothetical protein K439DRAFT_1348761 [Ramaria rubella]|nr:hypothetical protein K439DRAFT_1348761 [Ramaria rubella]